MGQGKCKLIAIHASNDTAENTIIKGSDLFKRGYEFTPKEGVVDGYSLPEKMRASLMELDDLTNKKRKEYLAIYDLEGNLLFGPFSSNERGSVSLPKEGINIIKSASANSLVLVHTHPENASFSPGDLKSTFGCKSVKTEVVIGRGNIMYSYDGQELRSNVKAKDLSLLNILTNLENTTAHDRAVKNLFKGNIPSMAQKFLDENKACYDSMLTVIQNWAHGKYADKIGTTFIQDRVSVKINKIRPPTIKPTYDTWANRVNESLILFMGAKNVSYSTQRLRDASQNASTGKI